MCCSCTGAFFLLNNQLRIAVQGHILRDGKKVKAGKDDSIFSGSGTDYKGKNSVEVWLPFLFGTKINPADHTHEFTWTGKTCRNAWSQDVSIAYTWDNSTDGNVLEIRNVCIIGPDASTYSFTPFTLEEGSLTASNEIKDMEMPYNMATFCIDGVQFRLQAQCMKFKRASQCRLFTMKNQVFRIVDEAGIVYAEFDESSYRIFDTQKLSSEKLLPCVAAFSVLYVTRVQNKSCWTVTL